MSRGFTDAVTGVSHYEWAFGTDVNAMARFTVVPAFQVSDAGVGEVTAYYPLQHGQTYYVTVRAYDGAGNMASKSSNGVKVDSTPPSAAGAIVTDTGTQAQYPLGTRRLLRAHVRSVCTSSPHARVPLRRPFCS